MKNKMRMLFLVAASASLALADINLTTAGSTGTILGTIGGTGIYVQGPQTPAGTGNIQSFVRLEAGGQNLNEQGFNTDGALAYDENNSPTFTHSLLTSIVPLIVCGSATLPTTTGCLAGQQYYQFGLDINQNNNVDDAPLSLDRVVIAFGSAPNATASGTAPANGTQLGANPAGFLTGGTINYIYSAGGATDLAQLNGSLSSGSGVGDMFLYVLRNAGAELQYTYLYSEFGLFGTAPENPCTPSGGGYTCATGAQQGTNDGFEEWFVQGTSVPPPPVPEPASIVLFGTTLAVSLTLLRKKFAGKQ